MYLNNLYKMATATAAVILLPGCIGPFASSKVPGNFQFQKKPRYGLVAMSVQCRGEKDGKAELSYGTGVDTLYKVYLKDKKKKFKFHKIVALNKKQEKIIKVLFSRRKNMVLCFTCKY